MLAEKIKQLRKQAKLSQEQLAEKLNVSRQAVTKWETGAGIPDIENLRSIAALFQISLDDLLENRDTGSKPQDFLFESATEYDIDGLKNYDITFMGANSVILSGYEGEKIRIRLASNQITGLQNSFKVKLDDIKHKIDIDIKRISSVSETAAKASLFIFIYLPLNYAGIAELSGNTASLEIRGMNLERIEFSGKVSSVILCDSDTHMELNSNEDMEISCQNFSGRLDINQLSSTSRLFLPDGLIFQTVTKGIANRILFGKDGTETEEFPLRGQGDSLSQVTIELNGVKSELVIASAQSV